MDNIDISEYANWYWLSKTVIGDLYPSLGMAP